MHKELLTPRSKQAMIAVQEARPHLVGSQRFLHRLLDSYGVTESRKTQVIHSRAVKLDISVVEHPAPKVLVQPDFFNRAKLKVIRSALEEAAFVDQS